MSLDPIEKIFEKGREIALDKKKKDAMHQELLMFMEKNPFKGGVARKRGFDFWSLHINSFRLNSSAIALASVMLVLGAGGIASVAADSALPGNFLYPVKIEVNEKVREVLAFSDEAKLELNMSLAQLRLQEIEQLAVEGKIDSMSEVKIKDNFNDHSQKASAYLSKLNKKGDNKKMETLSAHFEASLRAHHIILDGLSRLQGNQGSITESGQKEESNETDSIGNDILNAASSVSDINAIAASNNNISADGKTFNREKNIQEKISSVEKSVGEIKKIIEDNKANMGSEAVSQSEENLNLIQQKLDEGKDRLLEEKNGYEDSLSSFYDASVIAQESKDLINATTRLGIKIPINIKSHYNKKGRNNEESQNKQPVDKNVGADEKMEIKNSLEAQDLLK